MGGDVTGSAKEMNLLRTEGALTCQWRPQEIKQRRERWPHGGSGGFPDPSFKHLRQGHGPQTPGRRTCNEHTPSENWWPLNLTHLRPRPLNPKTHFSREERTWPKVAWSALSFQRRINTRLSMRSAAWHRGW